MSERRDDGAGVRILVVGARQQRRLRGVDQVDDGFGPCSGDAHW